jgi:hypothetical protein
LLLPVEKGTTMSKAGGAGEGNVFRRDAACLAANVRDYIVGDCRTLSTGIGRAEKAACKRFGL